MKKQLAAKGSYTPEYELNKFESCQRRFFPPMRSITFFACHKPGNIVAYCKTKQIQSNQKKMEKMKRLPQANKWRGQAFTRYTNRFHGYCFCCKGFGHKAIECKTYGQRLMFKTPRRFMNNGEFTRIHNPFRNIIKCFFYHQIGHKSQKCPLKDCGPSSQERY